MLRCDCGKSAAGEVNQTKYSTYNRSLILFWRRCRRITGCLCQTSEWWWWWWWCWWRCQWLNVISLIEKVLMNLILSLKYRQISVFYALEFTNIKVMLSFRNDRWFGCKRDHRKLKCLMQSGFVVSVSARPVTELPSKGDSHI